MALSFDVTETVAIPHARALAGIGDYWRALALGSRLQREGTGTTFRIISGDYALFPVRGSVALHDDGNGRTRVELHGAIEGIDVPAIARGLVGQVLRERIATAVRRSVDYVSDPGRGPVLRGGLDIDVDDVSEVPLNAARRELPELWVELGMGSTLTAEPGRAGTFRVVPSPWALLPISGTLTATASPGGTAVQLRGTLQGLSIPFFARGHVAGVMREMIGRAMPRAAAFHRERGVGGVAA